MEYNTTSPLLDLAMKFKTEQAFDTGYTALKGNAFSFDNYNTEKTLRFFTSEVRDNAVLHLKSLLEEGTDFSLADFI
jgi:hypothetical protein